MSNLQNLIKAANNGDIYAMVDLGVSYRLAYNGAKRDLDEAMKWFDMAAKMMHPEAYCYMGYALEIPVGYLDPNDDEADYKRAFGYFVKGALLDDPTSFYKLGDMYYSGKYVDIDCDHASLLYKKCLAMIDDDPDAYVYPGLYLRIGECYYKGVGNERDLNKACEYLTFAIDEYDGRISWGDPPDFIMPSYNRAKFLLKRAKAGKLIEQSIHNVKNHEVYDDMETRFLAYVKRVLPDKSKDCEALKGLIEMYRNGNHVDKDEEFANHLEKLSNETEALDE